MSKKTSSFKEKETERFTVRVAKEDYEQLKKISFVKNESINSLFNKAIKLLIRYETEPHLKVKPPR